jgi:hypothetical protein
MSQTVPYNEILCARYVSVDEQSNAVASRCLPTSLRSPVSVCGGGGASAPHTAAFLLPEQHLDLRTCTPAHTHASLSTQCCAMLCLVVCAVPHPAPHRTTLHCASLLSLVLLLCAERGSDHCARHACDLCVILRSFRAVSCVCWRVRRQGGRLGTGRCARCGWWCAAQQRHQWRGAGLHSCSMWHLTPMGADGAQQPVYVASHTATINNPYEQQQASWVTPSVTPLLTCE